MYGGIAPLSAPLTPILGLIQWAGMHIPSVGCCRPRSLCAQVYDAAFALYERKLYHFEHSLSRANALWCGFSHFIIAFACILLVHPALRASFFEFAVPRTHRAAARFVFHLRAHPTAGLLRFLHILHLSFQFEALSSGPTL